MSSTTLPQRSPWVSRLEITTYLVVLTVCAVILSERAMGYLQPSDQPLAKGDRIEALRDLVPENAERGFVMVLSPDCQFCTASLPSLGQLAQERDRRGSTVGIAGVVATAEHLEAESALLAEAGVRVDQLVQVDPRALRVRGVPTTLLVDRGGKILESWVGQINATRAEAMMEFL
ncbi:MAG: hypothetical protein AAF657_23150 [Acidobacteriota bacterium]